MEIDFNKAKVTRFDYGLNVALNMKVDSCLKLLNSKSRSKKEVRYSRTMAHETVYFHTNDRVLCFYDKIADLKAKRQDLLVDKNTNLLRIELRFLGRLPKVFNVPYITAEMLSEDWFVDKVAAMLYNDYCKVVKMHSPTAKIDCSNAKKFTASLAMHGVKAIGGIGEAMQQINSASYTSATAKHRLHQTLKRLNVETIEEPSSALIRELDFKVRLMTSQVA